MEWNDDNIGKLRALWDEGHSTAEIGRRLGVSKNAVVGKAHRLQLAARPSPIRRDGDKTQRRRLPRRSVGPTLPTLQTSLPAAIAASSNIIGPEKEPVGSQRGERPAPMLRAVPAYRPGARVTPCCWPIGEPGTKSFRFCDVNALSGKPYCEDHSALAYVKIRDRKEDAA